MSTLKGTTMHPRCHHIGACWDLLEWFQQHKSKYKSHSISNFKKKNQIFWFPCCSTREDLSIDVSITYEGLILTKPGRFFFSAYGNSGYGQNSISSISNFLKNFHISGFPWCSTREDHSIGVSITNVGLILTKLCWYLFSGCGQTADDPYMPPRRSGMHKNEWNECKVVWRAFFYHFCK